VEATRRQILARWALLACVVVVAALTTEQEDWEPLALVLALGVVMTIAEVAVVWTRRLRASGGLVVQSTAMALLGPAPAVAIGLVATVADSAVNRVRSLYALLNLVTIAIFGLVGGVLFETLGERFGLDRDDAAYALLFLPVYALLLALNLVLLVGLHPALAPAERRRVLRESAAPALPVELASGILGAVVVYAWSVVGMAAIAGLLVVQLLTIALGRTLGEAMRSDERAAEVARLASDRDRLLTEVLQAEDRERARLAESLHDGPMQRLAALRQDAAEGRTDPAELDRAIAETRAIVSAFHPTTVRELGFEAALRAAAAPFPTARAVALTVRLTVDDGALAGTVLMPIARELVVNAVKHASPSRIDVVVGAQDGEVHLEVNDDGVGIDVERAGRAVRAGHVGLAAVRRRVEDVGGRLEISTRGDGGTRSRVVMPRPATLS
jgi:signal transduction histidine kinase